MLKYNFSKKFKIGNNTISTKSKTFIIAEIGINHEGSCIELFKNDIFSS